MNNAINYFAGIMVTLRNVRLDIAAVEIIIEELPLGAEREAARLEWDRLMAIEGGLSKVEIEMDRACLEMA